MSAAPNNHNSPHLSYYLSKGAAAAEDCNKTLVLPFEIRADPVKGRGLFARHDLEENSLVHIAPCIPITTEEYENHMKFTCLEHYLFNCRATGEKFLALGYGSLFNHHSTHPNIIYKVYPKEKEIRFYVGYKPIQCNEELCISYGSKLWFQDANINANTDDDDDDDNNSDDSSSSTCADFLCRIEL